MKNTGKSQAINDSGIYALKALTDAVNKLKEECRRTGKASNRLGCEEEESG